MKLRNKNKMHKQKNMMRHQQQRFMNDVHFLFEKKISLNDDENSEIRCQKMYNSHPSKMSHRYDNVAKFTIHRNCLS